MGDRDDVVDVGVFGEEIGFDFLDGVVDGGGDALDGGADAEDVFRADGAVGVDVALEGEASSGSGVVPRQWAGEMVERGQLGDGEDAFVDPCAGGDVIVCVADDHAVADVRVHLWGWRTSATLWASGMASMRVRPESKLGAGGEAALVDDDGDVVRGVDLDVERFGGDCWHCCSRIVLRLLHL